MRDDIFQYRQHYNNYNLYYSNNYYNIRDNNDNNGNQYNNNYYYNNEDNNDNNGNLYHNYSWYNHTYNFRYISYLLLFTFWSKFYMYNPIPSIIQVNKLVVGVIMHHPAKSVLREMVQAGVMEIVSGATTTTVWSQNKVLNKFSQFYKYLLLMIQYIQYTYEIPPHLDYSGIVKILILYQYNLIKNGIKN